MNYNFPVGYISIDVKFQTQAYFYLNLKKNQ